MRLVCPRCGTLHIDEGEFATKPHHTHACQSCGEVWRPAIVATVGVRFLPGFKNAEDTAADTLSGFSDEPVESDRWHERMSPRMQRVLAELPNTVSVRATHALLNRDVRTLAGLIAIPLHELRKTKNLGRGSIVGIQTALAAFGLKLDGQPLATELAHGR
ncbi:MAG TPA: DNA-directed RNA polymerase subunit alpha C-terminal domain-containing protein [Steroidobacteraceae bacterium]|nr:DNA-directed RNA polymerase subunit alpha C-terminal domain-containing protein [Steroidobacteraceae bacterium]